MNLFMKTVQNTWKKAKLREVVDITNLEFKRLVSLEYVVLYPFVFSFIVWHRSDVERLAKMFRII